MWTTVRVHVSLTSPQSRLSIQHTHTHTHTRTHAPLRLWGADCDAGCDAPSDSWPFSPASVASDRSEATCTKRPCVQGCELQLTLAHKGTKGRTCTRKYTRSHVFTRTHARTHTLTHRRVYIHAHSLLRSLLHSLLHSFSHPFTHSLTHSSTR